MTETATQRFGLWAAMPDDIFDEIERNTRAAYQSPPEEKATNIAAAAAMHRRIPVLYVPEPVQSFAQNHEDVLLYRCLHGIKDGFYVDIGAGNPIHDSVTNWFYLIGWNGINIEPNPEQFRMLPEYRPRDVNLNIGIYETSGTLPFYQVKSNSVGHGWGLSSFDKSTPELATDLGFDHTVIEIEVRTLNSVLDEHAAEKVIDFLKIDVEGLEFCIIQSTDFRKHRPRVLCIEANHALWAMPRWLEWEPCLLNSGYLFACYDGLNNYYVREEDYGLLSQFQAGVNVHDHFLDKQAEDGAKRAEERAKQAEAALDAVLSSTSWRVTRPLRVAGQRISPKLRRALHRLPRLFGGS